MMRWSHAPGRTRHDARESANRGPMALLVVAIIVAASIDVAARADNPVYVDDSPRAWEIFRQAQDQAQDNAGEAVRLYQELLDDYTFKLLPVHDTAENHFVGVRARVLAELKDNARLQRRYRTIEAAAAERLLAGNQLRELALTRPLTQAGLQALLRLGQEALESARFRATLTWLREALEHPDLTGRESVHAWYMIGVAAHYLEHFGLRAEAMDNLAVQGAAARSLHASLSRLDEGGAAAPGEPPVVPFDVGSASELDEIVAQPIWSIAMQGTPLGRRAQRDRLIEGSEDDSLQHERQSGLMLTTAATVQGTTIFVNEGRTIQAIDRFTGRAIWPTYTDPGGTGDLDRHSQIADVNVVAVEGNLLVTYTGHAYHDSREMNRSNRNVVCLDTRTGELRWTHRIDRIRSADHDLRNLVPHGVPLVAEGTVFVLARKAMAQQLTGCYLVAIDLPTGEVLFSRHIASSAGIRSRATRPYSTPVYHQGNVVVSTPIGAVARINATTGETKWLRRYPPPLNEPPDNDQPWEILQPGVTPRGVITLSPDERRVLLLNWEHGDELLSLVSAGSDAWNSPEYFIAAGDLVLAISEDVRAFHVDAPERPLWRFPAEAPRRGAPAADSVDLRGRVQLVDESLIVPTSSSVVIVDVETGGVLSELPVSLVANPLASGPQLLLAGADRLEAYMPVNRAEAMLRTRLAASPADPAAALSLLQLGLRIRDLPLSLEAAELAMTAINVDPLSPLADSARRELFAQLLEVHEAGVADSVELGEQLYAVIGTVALDPLQQVEYRLGYGDWLSDHAAARAIESYQSILSTPSLARAMRGEDGLELPAATWSADRIAAVINTHGAQVYEPQSEFARLRLNQLSDDPGTQIPDLLALVHEFPFSPAAADAALLVAERYTSNRNVKSALDVLVQLYRIDSRSETAARLLGHATAHAMQAQWRSYAASLLRHVARHYGNIALETPGGAQLAEPWLDSMNASVTPDSRPTIGSWRTAGQPVPDPRSMSGSVVETLNKTIRIPTHVVLLAQDGPRAQPAGLPRLRLISANTLEDVWVRPVTTEAHQDRFILRFTPDELVVWLVTRDGDGKAMVIAPATGQLRWETPWMSSEEVFGPVMRGERRIRGAPSIEECLPLVDRQRLIVVRRAGDVAAFDLDRGGELIWHSSIGNALGSIQHVALDDSGLALAGHRSVRGADTASLIVLDPTTGEGRLELPTLDGEMPAWLHIDEFGSVVYGNDAGIESIDLLTGASRWRNVATWARRSRRAWPIDGKLLLEFEPNRRARTPTPLRVLSTERGDIGATFQRDPRGEQGSRDLVDIIIDREAILALYRQRLLRFDTSGRVIGADVGEERAYTKLVLSEDRIILLSSIRTRRPRAQGQHDYKLYMMSENGRLLDNTLSLSQLDDTIRTAMIIDGWILLSGGRSTIAIAAPAN